MHCSHPLSEPSGTHEFHHHLTLVQSHLLGLRSCPCVCFVCDLITTFTHNSVHDMVSFLASCSSNKNVVLQPKPPRPHRLNLGLFGLAPHHLFVSLIVHLSSWLFHRRSQVVSMPKRCLKFKSLKTVVTIFSQGQGFLLSSSCSHAAWSPCCDLASQVVDMT